MMMKKYILTLALRLKHTVFLAFTDSFLYLCGTLLLTPKTTLMFQNNEKKYNHFTIDCRYHWNTLL